MKNVIFIGNVNDLATAIAVIRVGKYLSIKRKSCTSLLTRPEINFRSLGAGFDKRLFN